LIIVCFNLSSDLMKATYCVCCRNRLFALLFNMLYSIPLHRSLNSYYLSATSELNCRLYSDVSTAARCSYSFQWLLVFCRCPDELCNVIHWCLFLKSGAWIGLSVAACMSRYHRANARASSVMDDQFAFLCEHASFRHPLNNNPLTSHASAVAQGSVVRAMSASYGKSLYLTPRRNQTP
jgi:hypothetical protein